MTLDDQIAQARTVKADAERELEATPLHSIQRAKKIRAVETADFNLRQLELVAINEVALAKVKAALEADVRQKNDRPEDAAADQQGQKDVKDVADIAGAMGGQGGAPVEGTRQIRVRGVTHSVAPNDALALFGALAMAVDGETAEVRLASGETLTLSHEDVSELGRQLAGKPADEIPG